MTRQEIEALGQAMLKEQGLSDWRVRAVHEEDDTGDPEDDIEGSRGRCYYEEKLIWVNMRYACDILMVREILLHEITHALVGKISNSHGSEFGTKAKEIGLGQAKLFEPRNACMVCGGQPSRSQPCLCDECDWRHGVGVHPIHEGPSWCAKHDPANQDFGLPGRDGHPARFPSGAVTNQRE